MKFGKRLGAEAARGWRGSYLDYKACKRAIRKDVEAGGKFLLLFYAGGRLIMLLSGLEYVYEPSLTGIYPSSLAYTDRSKRLADVCVCVSFLDAKGHNFEQQSGWSCRRSVPSLWTGKRSLR